MQITTNRIREKFDHGKFQQLLLQLVLFDFLYLLPILFLLYINNIEHTIPLFLLAFAPIALSACMMEFSQLDILLLCVLATVISIPLIKTLLFVNAQTALPLGISMSIIFIFTKHFSREKFLFHLKFSLVSLVVINLIFCSLQILSSHAGPRLIGAFDSPLALGLFSTFSLFAVLHFASTNRYWIPVLFPIAGMLLLAQAKWCLLVTLIGFFFIGLKFARKIWPLVALSVGLLLTLMARHILEVCGAIFKILNNSSFSAKPAAVKVFLANWYHHPGIILFGDTKQTWHWFVHTMLMLPGQDAITSKLLESWLLELVSLYGILSWGLLVFLFLPLIKRRTSQTAAFIFIASISACIYSTSGLAPPLNIYIFGLAAYFLAHSSEEALIPAQL